MNSKIKAVKTLEMCKPDVCVIGLGEVGFPVACYAYNKGLNVWGYDISSDMVERAAKEGKFKTTSSWFEVPQVNAYIICVTTGQKGSCSDLSAIFGVCKKIAEKASANALVSIESTIIPGTSKKIFSEIFKGEINIVHAPHRYWADNSEKFGVNQVRVIGAVNGESLKAGLRLYREKLDIPLYVCPTVEVAEMCKITENSHRYLQIAFAEDLKMMCEKIGIDFNDLREACNTKWNVNILEARKGIGRHCLPKDTKYVTTLARSTILESAMKVDKKYREWIAKPERQ